MIPKTATNTQYPKQQHTHNTKYFIAKSAINIPPSKRPAEITWISTVTYIVKWPLQEYCKIY